MRALAAVFGVWCVCGAVACARSGLELAATDDGVPSGDDTLDAGTPSDAGSDAGSQSGSLEGLCGEYVEAMCRFYTECFDEVFRDHAQCVSELECYGVENLENAVREGRVGYDAARVRECFETLRSEPCALPVLGTLQNEAFGVDRLLRACKGAVEPHQQQGDVCFATGECVYGHRCIETNGCPGSCERVPGWQEPCLEGGHCYNPQACLEGVCRLLARAGEPCSSPLDCREDLDCAPNGRCTTVERARLGEPCRLDLNGAKPARLCDEGLFCFLEQDLGGTCRPLATGGESCVSDASCLPGHFCSNLAAPTQPVCHPLGGIGALCNQDAWCREGLRCGGPLTADGRFGTCSLPFALGEPCGGVGIRGSCDDGLICNGQRCLNARYDGEACDDPLATCVRGTCVEGRCRGFARLGQNCDMPDDCLSRSCESGRCADRSLCMPR
ncbi:MAG TPA: Dickkopf N-terminal cysteine-rich domain-containing protein [Polyangiaceae bacterium]